MSRENKPLKVCFPAGERVTAQVTVVPGSRVVVQVPKFDIKFSVEQAKYKEALRRLEKYLEDLILKGMADEDSNPSIGADFDPGRAQGEGAGRKAKRHKRARHLAGIYAGTRWREPAEDIGGGLADPEVAEGSDPPAEREDQGGD